MNLNSLALRLVRLPIRTPAGKRPANRALGPIERVRMPLFAVFVAGVLRQALVRSDREWRAGFLLGLFTSTYSTAFVTLGASRIGRNPRVDWMELTPTAFGTGMIERKPSLRSILGGVFVHQSADILWSTLLFGLGGRPLARSPGLLTALIAPWAVLTSIIEYYLILPWWQPFVPRQVPYWTALTVHLASGAAYVEYPLARQLAGRGRTHLGFARAGALVLALPIAGLIVLRLLAKAGREPAWPFDDERSREASRTFLRKMVSHHRVGVILATLAADHGVTPEIRMLGRLMVAQHEAELQVMRQWWRSWFGGAVPKLDDEEYASMAGMPHPAALEELRLKRGDDFEQGFLALMIPHHQGAVLMSDDAIAHARDPRVALLADSIRHVQQAQIERMMAQSLAPKHPVNARDLFQATA